MNIGIISIIIAGIALLLNLIVVGAQSKTIKYQKAYIEGLERIVAKQDGIIKTQRDAIDYFERALGGDLVIEPEDLPMDVIKEIQAHAIDYYVAAHKKENAPEGEEVI